MDSTSRKDPKTQEAIMAASCPSVRRGWPGNDDNVDGAGEILVVVKFVGSVGIIGEAEDNNTAVAERTGGGVNEGEPRPVSLGAQEEVSGIPVGGGEVNSLLENLVTVRDTYRLSRRGWYPIRHSYHKALTLSLKSSLPVLRKECISDNRFPLFVPRRQSSGSKPSDPVAQSGYSPPDRTCSSKHPFSPYTPHPCPPDTNNPSLGPDRGQPCKNSPFVSDNCRHRDRAGHSQFLPRRQIMT